MLCFYKQKTADEMLISDRSSDVCSSDLRAAVLKLLAADHIDGHRAVGNGAVADAAAGDDDRLRRIERPAAGRRLVIGRLAKRRRGDGGGAASERDKQGRAHDILPVRSGSMPGRSGGMSCRCHYIATQRGFIRQKLLQHCNGASCSESV